MSKLRTGQPIPRRPREVKPSPRQLRWLFSGPRDKLDQQQVEYLDTLFAQTPQAKKVYILVQEFLEMITQRRAKLLDHWLERAEGSRVRFLRSFARGIRRDYEAVAGALKYSWSNGQVEGHVNRLKMLKRQMYGRAGIKLLRQRFLGMS